MFEINLIMLLMTNTMNIREEGILPPPPLITCRSILKGSRSLLAFPYPYLYQKRGYVYMDLFVNVQCFLV